MDITIPADAVKDVVHAAIMQALDADLREKLIGDALRYLTQPTMIEQRYGPPTEGPSVLADAFQTAVRIAAQGIVRDMVAADEVFVGRIRTLVGEAVAQFESEAYRRVVTEAIAEALRKDDSR